MDELHGTLLWREGVTRHVASTFQEGLIKAVAARPELVLVEHELPQATRLVRDLRGDPSTRHLSIAVMVRGDAGLPEVELLASGANAVLRLPAGPDWDGRLGRLIGVAARREARLPVAIELIALPGGTVEHVEGTALNISASGMLLECAAELPVGTDVDLSFRLPGSREEIVGCACVVRHDGPGRHGLCFYALERGGAERISAFVLAASAGDGDRLA
jgi:CheY-like chemotaxis protein